MSFLPLTKYNLNFVNNLIRDIQNYSPTFNSFPLSSSFISLSNTNIKFEFKIPKNKKPIQDKIGKLQINHLVLGSPTLWRHVRESLLLNVFIEGHRRTQSKQLSSAYREDSPDPRLACCRRNNSFCRWKEEKRQNRFHSATRHWVFLSKFQIGGEEKDAHTDTAASHMQKPLHIDIKTSFFHYPCKVAESDLSGWLGPLFGKVENALSSKDRFPRPSNFLPFAHNVFFLFLKIGSCKINLNFEIWKTRKNKETRVKTLW